MSIRKDEIISLLKADKSVEAVDLLMEFFEESSREYSELICFSAQVERVEKAFFVGVIKWEDLNHSKSKVVQGLVRILDTIDSYAKIKASTQTLEQEFITKTDKRLESLMKSFRGSAKDLMIEVQNERFHQKLAEFLGITPEELDDIDYRFEEVNEEIYMGDYLVLSNVPPRIQQRIEQSFRPSDFKDSMKTWGAELVYMLLPYELDNYGGESFDH